MMLFQMIKYKYRKLLIVFLILISCNKLITFLFSSFLINKHQVVNEHVDNKIFLTHEWIFNLNVSQYSSFATINTKEQSVTIESMIFLDHIVTNVTYSSKYSHNWHYITEHIKCYFKIKNRFLTLKPIDIRNMSQFRNAIYVCKVKCKLTKELLSTDEYESVRLAIIDDSYFDYYVNNLFRNKKLIMFQQPDFYKLPEVKKWEIANCNHLVSILNHEKMSYLLNWIDFVRLFGYSKVTLYFKSIREYDEQMLRKKYGSYLTIFYYKTQMGEICRWQIEQFANSSRNELSEFLLNTCIRSYMKHFTNIDDSIYTYSAHERLINTACFLRHKYEYEFFSNFDMDDLIFPRHHKTNEQSLKSMKLNLLTKSEIEQYNMVKFVERLLLKYDRDPLTRVAYFYFNHFVMLLDTNNFLEQLRSQQKSFFTYFHGRNYLNVTNFSPKKAENVKHIVQTARLLNKTHYNPVAKFKKKWNKFCLYKVTDQPGKSILITNYSETIDQHLAVEISPYSRWINLSLDDGYYSHFRDTYVSSSITHYIKDKQESLENFKFDLEYLLYYLSISNLY